MTDNHFDPLDQRARQARDNLVTHLGDPDVTGARQSLQTRARRQRADQTRARLAAAAVVAVALAAGAGVLSIASGTSPGGGERNEEINSDDGRALLENLPSSPIDGKQSWRLPVGASPQSDLSDGDTVTIYGRGFEPNEALGVVHCGAEADTLNAGIDACDLGSSSGFSGVEYVSADAEGNVVASVRVRRLIETPGFGRIDCASAPERCLLGMGAISNYDRSGGVYINFAGAPAFEVPTLSVDGADTGLLPGQPTKVTVTGWVLTRAMRVQQCRVDGTDTEQCQTVFEAAPDEAVFTFDLMLNPTLLVDGREVPCGTDCILRATGVGVSIGSTAPQPDPVKLLFATPDTVTETVPPTTFTPMTTTTMAETGSTTPVTEVDPTIPVPTGPNDPVPTTEGISETITVPAP